MKTKQELLVTVLSNKLVQCKVGILIKGISGISPLDVMKSLSPYYSGLVAVAVGYDCVDYASDDLIMKTRIEDAVRWRSDPTHAGKIFAFVNNDSDKLHSLKELDVVTIRSLSECLIAERIVDAQQNQNRPTLDFWNALKEFLDGFSFETLLEFASIVESSPDKTKAIPENMWRLGLLCDLSILSANNKPKERLAQNRDLIIAMGQISEDHRKRLTSALAKVKNEDKEHYQKSYRGLQSFFKYGLKETLKELDFETVRDLLTAAKTPRKLKRPGEDDGLGGGSEVPIRSIKERELQKIIAGCIVDPEDGDDAFLVDLYEDILEHFGDSNNAASGEISTRYDDRSIILDKHDTPIRRLVRTLCTDTNWGGIIETDESILRDAIQTFKSSDNMFCPESLTSVTACDSRLTLFNCLREFDKQFRINNYDNVDYFEPILDELKVFRHGLVESLDIIMYFPVLGFGVKNELKKLLLDYTNIWAKLLSAFRKNATTMFGISHNLTRSAARSLLLLDLLYIKTPTEWKAILLPMHPIFLWRYAEIFKALESSSDFSETDSVNLADVFTKLPQVLNYVVVDSHITLDHSNVELPCSGTIEMLPTFENKTNRYLGYDGVESVEEILSRWLAFAPYTAYEVRICSVDAPDHASILKALTDFLAKNEDGKVVYQIFLTRKQNGNTEIAKLDYISKDYETGDLFRKGRLSVNISNVNNLAEVKEELGKHPVHVAFYFDQSCYKIEHGPSTQQLYINPLVVTYDYDYDPMTHRGEIFPSSNMESGIIGDYYKVMKDAELTTSSRTPRPTYNPDADIKDLTSTVKGGETIWLVAVDRTINNYRPEQTIPIGEKRCGLRTYGIWASRDSRIIEQYMILLRKYNLYPKKDILISTLQEFGHISSEGLISIPRFGGDATAIENRRKGLIGTVFAAKWFTKKYPGSLVASLDTHDARQWLRDITVEKRVTGSKDERADLIGLYWDETTQELHIVPIEVKTREDSPDALTESNPSGGKLLIRGHAADQIEVVINMLKDMFSGTSENMFVSARREVLKYQIVSECFRERDNHEWQLSWERRFKELFGKDPQRMNLRIHGLLIHVQLSEVRAGRIFSCIHNNNRECDIELVELTTYDINKEILITPTDSVQPIVYNGNINMPSPEGEKTISNHPEQSDIDSIEPIGTNDSELDEHQDDSSVSSPLGQPTISTSSTAQMVSLTPKVTTEEIEQLSKEFSRSCKQRGIILDNFDPSRAIIGASLIRYPFKLARGQKIQELRNHLEDIGREMQRSGVMVQPIINSSETYLDVPRLTRDHVLFSDARCQLPLITSIEQLPFSMGRTPDGRDLFKDLKDCPHLLVGGSTGSGKTVFLWSLLASLLLTHPRKENLQLMVSSSGLEDFVRFDGLPHLIGGTVYSDAVKTTEAIRDVVFAEFERRKDMLTKARVENIQKYNLINEEKMAPMVVVIDEFADLTDQLSSKKEQDEFYKPVRQIAQIGRKRGIHLVLCTQRPSAKLLPTDIKAQLGGRLALRVNEATSSRMIIDESGAQDLQKYGDMIYKNGSEIERAQGYLITGEEVDEIVRMVKERSQQ